LSFGQPLPSFNDKSNIQNGKVESMKPKANSTGIAIAFAALLFSTCMMTGALCQVPSHRLEPGESWKTEMTGGETPKPIDDTTLSHWWTVFGDPELSSLEERALKANLSLRTAEANILQARANRLSASSSSIPSVSVSGSGTGSRASTRSGGQAGQSYSAGLDASWEPDFYGKQHMNVRAYDADIQAAQESLRNTMVSLTAELALDYVNVRSYQAQLQVARENLVTYKDTYESTLAKQQSGLSSELDVQQALETVQSTEASIPTFETNLRQAANAIAVLLNELPGAIDAELAQVTPIPQIPSEVAVGIPADLLRRRPDVRTAERQLAAQSLRVGVAKANLYPTFTLSGSFLFSATNILNLLTPATMASSVVGSVQQSIVNRRQLKGQLKLQDALLDQYEVAYESSVLGAIQDVENSLQAFGAEQVRRKSLAGAALSAKNAALMSRELYGAGLKDFLNVLDSDRSALSLQNSLVQSDASVATDLIQLYKALGGGWQ
jgi:NodT family efflux transporter outer membrane factor (OMF) lipoprotein